MAYHDARRVREAMDEQERRAIADAEAEELAKAQAEAEGDAAVDESVASPDSE
jgi:DNA-directed RNA polymerase subunit beta'